MGESAESYFCDFGIFGSAVESRYSRVLNSIALKWVEKFAFSSLVKHLNREKRAFLQLKSLLSLQQYCLKQEYDEGIHCLDLATLLPTSFFSEEEIPEPSQPSENQLPEIEIVDHEGLRASSKIYPSFESRGNSMFLDYGRSFSFNARLGSPLPHLNGQSKVISSPPSRETEKMLMGCLTVQFATKHALLLTLQEVVSVNIEVSQLLAYYTSEKAHPWHYGLMTARNGKLFSQFFCGSSAVSDELYKRVRCLRALERILITLIGALYFVIYGSLIHAGKIKENFSNFSLDCRACCVRLHTQLFLTLSKARMLIEGCLEQLDEWIEVSELGRKEASCSFSVMEGNGGPNKDSWVRSALVAKDPATIEKQKSYSIGVIVECINTAIRLKSALTAITAANRIPFLSRYGRLLIAAPLLLATSITVLVPFSPEDYQRRFIRYKETCNQLFDLYCLQPAKSIWSSFLYLRPDVKERLGMFYKEAEDVASILTDYHMDHEVDASSAEKKEFYDHTLNLLQRGISDDEVFNRINMHYRAALRHPFRSMLWGDLPRILLIRMSLQSLEVIRVVRGMDEVLESNRFNFQVMTIVPLLVASCMSMGWLWWKWRREVIPLHHRLRLRWRDVHQVLNGEVLLNEPSYSYRQGNALKNSYNFSNEMIFSAMDCTQMDLEDNQTEFSMELHSKPAVGAQLSKFSDLTSYEQGLLLLSVHDMRSSARWLYNYPLSNELLNDLEMLECTSLSCSSRLEVLNRMRATHRFL